VTSAQASQKQFPRICCEEPFRIFFPLGLACGLLGLVLWPLFLWGGLAIYPGLMHARIMIEGFMGAFIIGFLGTAGPRLLTARHFTALEVGSLLALYLAGIAAHITGRLAAGDTLFAAAIVMLAITLGRRFVARGELPPPNFVLVGFGLLNGIAGAAMVAWASRYPSWPWLYPLGILALSQGFVLLPVLGVGVFLFPRFLGVPFGEELADLRSPTPGWKRKASIAVITAVAIIGSFAVESVGLIRLGGGIRFLAAFLYTALQMPAVLRFRRAPFLGQCIRAAVWSLLLGLLWPVFLPAYRVTGLHIIFIGGFMLTVLTVATRVMLGHSGQVHLCQRPLSFMITASILLMIGMLTRIGADFMPGTEGRNIHLIYAAILCIGAGLVWGVRLIPRVFNSDTADEVPPPVPGEAKDRP
jgi:uncharacterized protein involved in response to NO